MMFWDSLVAHTVKHLPAMCETQVQSLGREDPLEKGLATHSSILAWEIPWTEGPGGLLSMESQRVGLSWATDHSRAVHDRESQETSPTVGAAGAAKSISSHSEPGTWGLGSLSRGFPGGSDGKASASNVGDLGLIPPSGRSPGEGTGYPLQYSCLENSTDRGAWRAIVHGVTKSRTQLSNHHLLTFYLLPTWRIS